jgi:hypothetical protein
MTDVALKRLRALDDRVPPALLASLKEFMVFAETADATLEALKSRYDLKPVGSDQKCRKSGLRQISLSASGIDYRALFVIRRKQDRAIWLDFFVKSPKQQTRLIARACAEVARMSQEGNQ